MFHNLGADKEKARSAVLLSALEIVFGTSKEILFRERRPGREGTWRRISSNLRSLLFCRLVQNVHCNAVEVRLN